MPPAIPSSPANSSPSIPLPSLPPSWPSTGLPQTPSIQSVRPHQKAPAFARRVCHCAPSPQSDPPPPHSSETPQTPIQNYQNLTAQSFVHPLPSIAPLFLSHLYQD